MNQLIVEGLGKRYELASSADERTPTGVLRRLAVRVRRSTTNGQEREQSREFWALRDVSFLVEPGTVLGVIGANGAGKTTLLKILARIITPTEGRVVGSGRVVSLLELGAGFDPDLSARENIFLNAAMLGVPRAVVTRRFDQILEFAEVDTFVDTPLKHYSSGMYLRLAFSVAINMEPSILLADEILAVGDESFQERCLERVKQEAERGLTVLFVSHDMEAIVRVCDRTLWLNAGRVLGFGDSEEVVADYQTSVWARGMTGSERGRHVNRFAIIHDVKVVTEDGREVRGMPTNEMTYLRMRFELLENHLCACAAYDVRARGQLIFRTADPLGMRVFRTGGMWEALMRLPHRFFNEMTYSVVPSLTVAREGEGRRQYVLMGEPLSFIVYAPDGTERREKDVRASGYLTPQFRWKFQRVDEQPEGVQGVARF
ncbi:MAG: ATP-binding cassette domain-containing protein [Acidobacteria bacterium]|nr:ATP-binding cassette domain-containing protein [Acidobacteriota bacterium]